jgi:hypothetical protein
MNISNANKEWLEYETLLIGKSRSRVVPVISVESKVNEMETEINRLKSLNSYYKSCAISGETPTAEAVEKINDRYLPK